MRLKIGELARRAGLSVRALRHYDAIGLLSPSGRSEGGARLYGADDLVRLHRIEALKQMAYSLADIKASLDGQPAQEILSRQIAALDVQAARARRLSRQLHHMLDLVSSGGNAAADDWLNTLELMNMYDKHLSDDEREAWLKPDGTTVQQTDPAWTHLIGEVREAMGQAMSPNSATAQDLSWRWMKLVIRMTRNDPVLAGKLFQLQLQEGRAQDIVGIGPQMLRWIGESFAHARCQLFARYLSPEQLEHVRNRQLAHMTHMQAWPALVADLREQMAAGTDVAAPAVQAIVRRWQQLFRDSYCGDDAALEARVREAFSQEPDLQLGVGVDEALLTYLHRAHVAAHPLPQGNAGPKPSALMVAMQRAAHQVVDSPRVLDDPLALRILGPVESRAVLADPDSFRQPLAQGLRSSVVVRSRFAEDEWAASMARGVRQYVVLGAGLDTSAYRHANAPGQMFEVDLPATQTWKRARLVEAGIPTPPSLRYAGVDFETISLAQGLADAGFDASQPAFFSWLGVCMYLDEPAVIETLRFIGRCAPGSAVVFDFITPFDGLPLMMRIAMKQLAARLAAGGEPWKTHFDPAALTNTLLALGFSQSRSWSPEELNARYLSDRTDGLRMGAGPGRLMLALV
jgi:methyltransferase (TIGR00027 family)